MHKKLLNELQLDILIAPKGPLLIKSGQEAGADPTLLDMNFVRTTHARLGRTVYLPGSSLKGAVRSYCEKIGRTLDLDVCNPLKQGAGGEHDDGTRVGCGFRLGERARNWSGMQIYPELCPICQIFGHTVMAGHAWFSDGYPASPEIAARMNQTEERDGVAIDRVSGAVAVGPFQLEVVTRGVFRAGLTVRNFQIWQLGLLALALRDMGEGRVPLGFAKSRGLGRVEVSYERMQISYPGQFGGGNGKDFGANLYGVTQFDVESGYGYTPEPALPLTDAWSVDTGWGRADVSSQDGNAIQALLKSCVQPWADYVQARRGGTS